MPTTVLSLARCSHWSVILMARYFFHLKGGAGAALDGRVAIAIVHAAGSSLTIDTGVMNKFVASPRNLGSQINPTAATPLSTLRFDAVEGEMLMEKRSPPLDEASPPLDEAQSSLGPRPRVTRND